MTGNNRLPPESPVRLLVCGDREWDAPEYLNAILDAYHAVFTVGVVIEGEARGVDVMARAWAESRGIPVERYPADWTRHGRAAGPIRNRQMMREGQPDVVMAFHRNLAASKGTRDMVRVADREGVPVWVVPFEGRRPYWSPLP
jgi:predicted ATP-grasp superfamily ATP-dependent carboligase